MKIGILTLWLNTNYGGILQAYALQKKLRDMGHDVETLQPVPFQKRPFPLQILSYAKRVIKKCLGRNPKPIFYEDVMKRDSKIVSVNTHTFIDKYIKTRLIKSLSDIKPTDYDAIIVGSDQVWRQPFFRGDWQNDIPNAFLRFTKGWDIKRIAYAASFGIDKIEREYTLQDIKVCRMAAKLFDAISVREDSGVRICKEKFGVDAKHVLDPTMLLDKEDYIKLVEAANIPKSEGNLMCYILDQSEFKTKVVETIAKEKGLTPFYYDIKCDDISIPAAERIQPPVESWLRGFMDAEFVVTDSFHACVFSIILGKPFIAIGNAGRGLSRYYSLLGQFGLEDRLLMEDSSLDSKHLITRISLSSNSEINVRLQSLRNSSFQLLSSSVGC